MTDLTAISWYFKLKALELIIGWIIGGVILVVFILYVILSVIYDV